MEETQVGNAESNSAPEGLISDDASNDFFGALEQEVNGGIVDGEINDTSAEQSQSGNTQTEEQVNAPADEAQQEDVETLKKRYADSSAEGKRLNTRLKELEPYMPILDEMRKDPSLVSHVRGYFEGGGQAPESMVEKMKLGEDFVFDPDDAVGNPGSDSAKVLNAHVDELVKRRIKTMIEGQMKNVKMNNMAEDKRVAEAEFKQKHSMTDEEFAGMVEKAKSHQMSLDDIYYLVNKEKIDANIADNARADVMKQMQNVKNIPKTIGSVNSLGKTSKSDDDKIFDSILGSEQNLDSLFG